MSSNSDRPPFGDSRWDTLPHLLFTREQPGTSDEELAQPDKAYGVHSAETLAQEFENRLRTLRGALAKTAKTQAT